MCEEVLGQRIDAIVSSPMRRALQTALLTLDFIMDRGVRVIPDPRWQGSESCLQNTGC
jgi:broad specificity phosphatase PhoE